MTKKILSVVIDSAVFDHLKCLARQQSVEQNKDIKLSHLVRQAINEFLKKSEKK